MKTITLEEIYADPHMLDPLLAAGEPVDIVKAGKNVGQLRPTEDTAKKKDFVPFSGIDHRARMFALWGPDAFKSTRSVEEIIDAVRSPRGFRVL